MCDDLRLDQFLVKRGLVSTRSQSQDLIKRGQVTVNHVIIQRPSYLVKETDHIQLNQESQYVGRGALKLLGALKNFNVTIPIEGVAIDAGASTGGFTQVLLEKGVSKVYAIEGGHDQLHPELKNCSKVINLEKTNLRYPLDLPEKSQWLVVDLSFTSLWPIMPQLWPWLSTGAKSLILFKPQFELGPEGVTRRGIVKDLAAAQLRLKEFVNFCEGNGQKFLAQAPCTILGKEGNQEYFLYFEKESP